MSRRAPSRSKPGLGVITTTERGGIAKMDLKKVHNPNQRVRITRIGPEGRRFGVTPSGAYAEGASSASKAARKASRKRK